MVETHPTPASRRRHDEDHGVLGRVRPCHVRILPFHEVLRLPLLFVGDEDENGGGGGNKKKRPAVRSPSSASSPRQIGTDQSMLQTCKAAKEDSFSSTKAGLALTTRDFEQKQQRLYLLQLDDRLDLFITTTRPPLLTAR